MHPVVKGFLVSREALAVALRNEADPRSPILTALAALWDHQANNVGAAGGLKAAQAVPIGLSEDPDLNLLFLAMWAYSSLKSGRLSETEALLGRAGRLRAATTPPEIRSYLRDVESKLAGVRGDTARREELANEAIALLPRESSRRWLACWDRALFLSRLGRASEVGGDVDWLEENGPEEFVLPRVALVRFNDAVNTGRTAEAQSLLSAVEGDADLLRLVGRSFHRPRTLLDVMLGRPPGDHRTRPEAPPLTPAPWAPAMAGLLDGRVSSALRWARQAARGSPGDFVTGTGLVSYTLVRCELASGNGEAARRLLNMGRARGSGHYLDDFFLARVELLAGNGDGAAHLFAAFLKSIEKYRAEGLLDFELRMAPEIPPGDLLRLGRAADRIAEPRLPVPAAPPPSPELRGARRLVGHDPAAASVRDAILRLAPLEVPVLITGETGTGKELVARALHEESLRRDRPFVAINCGAIAETLLETELFGHEKGAFTGAEQAHLGVFDEAGEGTLFLDEIGEMSPKIQVSLLRVLETGEIRPVGSARSRRVACRIVAATNAPLDRRAEAGAFRKDLLFRLRRLEIALPPLRERPGDIAALAAHYLDVGRWEGLHAMMAPDLQEALLAYDWPGNVRELRNEIERMRLMNSDRLTYGMENLDPRIAASVQTVRGRADAGAENGERTGNLGAGPETPPSRREPAPSALPARILPAGEAGGGEPAGKDETVKGLGALSGGEPQPETWQENHSQLRRRELLRALFEKHKKLTRQEIARFLRVSLHTATQDLKVLREEGFIAKVEPSLSPRSHYFVLAASGKTEGSGG